MNAAAERVGPLFESWRPVEMVGIQGLRHKARHPQQGSAERSILQDPDDSARRSGGGSGILGASRRAGYATSAEELDS